MFETLSKLEVLVVDDLTSARKIMRRLLVGLGFEKVAEAPGGGAAFSACQEKRFDLIVADFNLQDMTGLELRKMLLEANQSPSFVLVTGEQNQEVLDSITEQGITLLLKPFSSDDLKSKIVAALTVAR
ncbi:MAG: response regulator [Bdellovibrionota bacterium]